MESRGIVLVCGSHPAPRSIIKPVCCYLLLAHAAESAYALKCLIVQCVLMSQKWQWKIRVSVWKPRLSVWWIAGLIHFIHVRKQFFHCGSFHNLQCRSNNWWANRWLIWNILYRTHRILHAWDSVNSPTYMKKTLLYCTLWGWNEQLGVVALAWAEFLKRKKKSCSGSSLWLVQNSEKNPTCTQTHHGDIMCNCNDWSWPEIEFPARIFSRA